MELRAGLGLLIPHNLNNVIPGLPMPKRLRAGRLDPGSMFSELASRLIIDPRMREDDCGEVRVSFS